MSSLLSDHVHTEGARNLSGSLRPSGRFSFAQIFPKRVTRFKDVKQQSKVSQALRTVQEVDDAYAALLGGQLPPLREASSGGSVSPGRIGSSIANNSDIRSPRGSKGISGSARDVLCWSANQLERVYTRKTMSFLTLTLPELSEGDLRAVQEGWSKVVNDVVREIKRELERHGLQTSVVGCTELQLERGESDRKSWPHLHLVFRGRRDAHSRWLVHPVRFREIWARCVCRLGLSRAYPWQSSENVQQVNKSSGGYLAKYISKGKSKGSQEVRDIWYPSDWIVCSRRLRGLYKALTISGYDIACTLANICFSWVHGMGYKQPVIISTPAYGDRIIGQWGWLKGEEKFLSPAEWYSAI